MKRQSPGGVLRKNYSEKFCWIHRITYIRVSFCWCCRFLACNFIKKRLWRRCFLSFWETFQDISRRLHRKVFSHYLLDAISTMCVSYQSEIFFVLRSSWSAIKWLACKEYKILFCIYFRFEKQKDYYKCDRIITNDFSRQYILMRVVSGEKSGGSWGILPCLISTFEKN